MNIYEIYGFVFQNSDLKKKSKKKCEFWFSNTFSNLMQFLPSNAKTALYSAFQWVWGKRPTGGRAPRWRPSELGTPDTATWSDLQYTRVFLSLLRAIWGKWSPAESWGLGVLHRFSKVREREGLRSQVGWRRLHSSLKLGTQEVCTWKEKSRSYYAWRGCRNSAPVSLYPWLTQNEIQSLGKEHFRGQTQHRPPFPIQRIFLRIHLDQEQFPWCDHCRKNQDHLSLKSRDLGNSTKLTLPEEKSSSDEPLMEYLRHSQALTSSNWFKLEQCVNNKSKQTFQCNKKTTTNRSRLNNKAEGSNTI